MTDSVRRTDEMPLVTALINSYNYGHFVEEAIDSVLAQDYPSDRVEVLVVDDGSTDDTAERVKNMGHEFSICLRRMAGRLPRLTLGSNERRGRSSRFWTPMTIGCRGSCHGWCKHSGNCRARGWCITGEPS